MKIVYEVNKKRAPTFQEYIALRKSYLLNDELGSSQELNHAFSLFSIGSGWQQQGDRMPSQQIGQDPQITRTIDFIDPWMLKFQDHEFQRIYEYSRFKEIIWWSKICLKLRAIYGLYVAYDVWQTISQLDHSQPQNKKHCELMRIYFQAISLGIHLLWIWLSAKSSSRFYYYLHTTVLQLSFSIFTLLSSQQSEIYRLIDNKLLLYLGHQSILFITTLNMSLSFITTTLGNVLSTFVINQFFLENLKISPQELFQLNLAVISILLFASYNQEYQYKVKIHFNSDAQFRLQQMHSIVNRTELGIFIKNGAVIKYQNNKVCDMFSSIIRDHSDNSEKMFLDKDYFYKKKFLPLSNFEELKFLNSICSIKNRAQKKIQNFSINELINGPKKEVFNFQDKNCLSLENLMVIKSTEIQFSGETESQMLVMAPVQISQLKQLFAVLEAVNQYYQEKYIENQCQNFDRSIVILDKMHEIVNKEDQYLLHYIESLKSKIDVLQYKMLLPMKFFSRSTLPLRMATKSLKQALKMETFGVQNFSFAPDSLLMKTSQSSNVNFEEYCQNLKMLLQEIAGSKFKIEISEGIPDHLHFDEEILTSILINLFGICMEMGKGIIYIFVSHSFKTQRLNIIIDQKSFMKYDKSQSGGQSPERNFLEQIEDSEITEYGGADHLSQNNLLIKLVSKLQEKTRGSFKYENRELGKKFTLQIQALSGNLAISEMWDEDEGNDLRVKSVPDI